MIVVILCPVPTLHHSLAAASDSISYSSTPFSYCQHNGYKPASRRRPILHRRLHRLTKTNKTSPDT